MFLPETGTPMVIDRNMTKLQVRTTLKLVPHLWKLETKLILQGLHLACFFYQLFASFITSC